MVCADQGREERPEVRITSIYYLLFTTENIKNISIQ